MAQNEHSVTSTRTQGKPTWNGNSCLTSVVATKATGRVCRLQTTAPFRNKEGHYSYWAGKINKTWKRHWENLCSSHYSNTFLINRENAKISKGMGNTAAITTPCENTLPLHCDIQSVRIKFFVLPYVSRSVPQPVCQVLLSSVTNQIYQDDKRSSGSEHRHSSAAKQPKEERQMQLPLCP